MRSILLYGYWLLSLLAHQAWAQAGLRGDYYAGTNFEQKAFSRTDPAIHFNWDRRSPGPGLSPSYYSIRWTGKLLAPTTGEYEFFAKVNDGIRVWVGGKLVLDSWQLNAYKHYRGRIVLSAGEYYELRVDYFNAIEWGEIYLFWKPPLTAASTLNPFAESGEIIPADYFFKKAPPSSVVPQRSALTPARRPVTVPPLLKPVAPPKPKVEKLKPPRPPLVSPRRMASDSLAAESTTVQPVNAESPPVIAPGVTLLLRTVQFEQSSYILLAQASTELNQLVQALKTNPQWHVHIGGHTDNVGDARLNLALSEQRAKVVATYLVRRGIHDERITTEGFGSSQPLGDNTTEGERSKNRRVTIVYFGVN